MNSEEDEFRRIEAEALRQSHQSKEPTPWRDMIVVSLVREGIDKHKARELADHFAAQRPWVDMTDEEMDTAVNSNITITDSRLRDGVYGVALDIAALLKEKNT